MRDSSLFIGVLVLIFAVYAVSAKGRDRPRNITVEAVNATALRVSWLHPRTIKRCPVSKYLIRFKHDDDKRSSATKVDGEETAVILSGLHSNTRYYVRLVTVGCRGKSPPTKWAKAKTQESTQSDGEIDRVETRAPGRPTDVRTKTFTDSIILTWQAPADNVLVRGYMVGYGEGVPDVNWQYVDATTRVFTIKNLKPSTQYVISLRAFNNYGKGPVVYDLLYTTEEHGPTIGPLSPPIGLISKVLSPSTVWLEWTDPSLGRAQKITDDRYYIVTYIRVPRGKGKSVTVRALSVVLYDLMPATMFEFRVKTIKGAASTSYGIGVYNTTYEAAPDTPPSSVAVKEGNITNSLTVSWLPPRRPNGRISGYLVLFSTTASVDERDWATQAVTGGVHSTTITELRPNTTYYVKVKARNHKGFGPACAAIMYQIGQQLPISAPGSSPKNLVMHETNVTSSLKLTWQPPIQEPGRTYPPITGYVVHFTTIRDDPEELWHKEEVAGTMTSAIISDLEEDTVYYFKVKAKNTKGEGPATVTVMYRIESDDQSDPPIVRELQSTPEVMEETEIKESPEEDDSPKASAMVSEFNQSEDDILQNVSTDDIRSTTVETQTTTQAKKMMPMMTTELSEINKEAQGVDPPRLENDEDDFDDIVDDEGIPSRDYRSRRVRLKTLVRHTVSAVLSWADGCARKRKPVHYVVTYYDEYDDVITVNTTETVLLIEGLKPGRQYRYEVNQIDSRTQDVLWTKSDFIDATCKDL